MQQGPSILSFLGWEEDGPQVRSTQEASNIISMKGKDWAGTEEYIDGSVNSFYYHKQAAEFPAVQIFWTI